MTKTVKNQLPFFTFANQKHLPIYQKCAVPKKSAAQDRV